jgi:hypothetical protein
VDSVNELRICGSIVGLSGFLARNKPIYPEEWSLVSMLVRSSRPSLDKSISRWLNVGVGDPWAHEFDSESCSVGCCKVLHSHIMEAPKQTVKP